ALISAVPVPDVDRPGGERIVLTGDVPSPIDPPNGCRFHPRRRFATARCKAERPRLHAISPGRTVACHHSLIGSVVAPAGEV
ncbi:MAG: dipeptide/oligopeptide/nickel ABC transporter ATP-binding protein, partial [Alphaproteobacteria bacterium]|nr:dipeptide/oligopeptide/nickel ABC transporter ATP-binding protein [Alphaproteobacteria bacterium]